MPNQLSLTEREKISQMRYTNASGTEIATALGRSRSTISRELKRNSTDGKYSAIRAQSLTESRKSERPFEQKMSRPGVNERVRKGLVSFWSPEQVSGRMKSDGLERDDRVSRSTIERWIRKDTQRKHWESFLRRRGKRKPENDRRGQLPSTVSITGRSAIVEERKRCGDWEGDTIVSPGKRSGLVCSTDRLSGVLMLNKVKNLKSSEVINKMRDQLKRVHPAFLWIW